MQLPLFPLSGIVMPGGLMPLRLFEPRYIDMVKNCFKTDTGFGVCLIKSGQEAGEIAEPYPRGTCVSIVDFDQGSDGLLHITVRGDEEFRILRHAANDNQLLIADVELIAASAPTIMQPEYELLAHKLEMILRYLEPDSRFESRQLDDADWVCHRLLELLPLSAEAKFELLQMQNNSDRLDSMSSLQIEIAEK